MILLQRLEKSFSEKLSRNWPLASRQGRSTTPVVSFTFDDFPQSAVTNGARILQSRGVRGSFYVAGSYEGRCEHDIDYFTREDLQALAEDQHEIGCHTFGHVRLPGAKPAQIHADLQRNAEFVDSALGGYRMSSFAYPYGHVNVFKKALIGRSFPLARGIWPGVNSRKIDIQQLKAIPLEKRSFDLPRILEALDAAKAVAGWVIFFSHDVSDSPSPYGCAPDDLARIVDASQERGFEILPVKNAAGRVFFGSATGH
jgi:peptidoglycan/xylan/chitin deacetylase (PgdA/CDA1 family)